MTTQRQVPGGPYVNETGTRQARGVLVGLSRLNSPWVRVTGVLPATQAPASTVISGMPGCRVKSWAMAVIGLPAAASTSRHRSSVVVLLWAWALM